MLNVEAQTQTELEAAAFRRLVAHLQEHTEVQNIDLMNLAGFCRNCLAKWVKAAAEEQGAEKFGGAGHAKSGGAASAENVLAAGDG